MHHQKFMKIGTKIQPFPDQISYSGADAGGVHNSWQAGSDKKQQYNRGHLERRLPAVWSHTDTALALAQHGAEGYPHLLRPWTSVQCMPQGR